ncbi:MAG TPA: hypothetical protein VHM90_12135, partial [Phycisphaerae bacterium]|nr:hypothetical protein [Phycisphaerae bacterium]
GYCGALRTHATIVTRDPIFGEFAYGALLMRNGDSVSVVPRDGLRVRFHVIRDQQRLHMELRGDGFAKEQPVVVNDALTRVAFTLENRAKAAHTGALELSGLPAGNYSVSVDGKAAAVKVTDSNASQVVDLPVGAGASAQVVIQKS